MQKYSAVNSNPIIHRRLILPVGTEVAGLAGNGEKFIDILFTA